MTGANGVNNDDCSMVTDSDLHQQVLRKYTERLLNVENELDREVESGVWRVLFASSEAHQIWEGRWSIRSVMVGEKLKASTGVSLQWLTAFWQKDTFPQICRTTS